VPDLDAWRTYVRKVVTTYGAQIDYQVWPEPNIRSNWEGSPAALAKLVAAASKIIHSNAPDALVVAPAMVLRMRYQRTFMDKFFAQKVGDRRIGRFVDAVGLDLYPIESGTPEDSMTLLAKARRILKEHKVSAPVWNVEINYGVAGAGQTVNPYGGAKQASYVARTYVLNAAAKVKRVYWLGWATYATMSIALATDDGAPTKAGRAFLTVASWLQGSTAHPCAIDREHHLYSCRLTKSGRSSWVYWTTRGQTVVRAPKGSRQWSDVTGDEHATRPGRRLTVASSPIWVHH
jgi:hypothetical protein